MFNESLKKALEQEREYYQNTFLQGRHNYWILQMEKEATIYDNDIEIYKYNEEHMDFLNILPSITDLFGEIEKKLKEYYNYAYSTLNNYDNAIAQKLLKEIENYFQGCEHPFLCFSNNYLLYVKRVIYEYFCQMVEYRFYLYLEKNKKRNSTLNIQDLESFREQDKIFFTNLFVPLYQLLYQDTDTSETSIHQTIVHLWYYFLYISHCYNALNANVTESELEKYTLQSHTDFIQKRASNTFILKNFKLISDMFTDYFSVFSDIKKVYPDIKIFHQYALLLSNNYFYEKIIDSCKFYSAHQSMYKMVIGHIRRQKPNHVAFMDTVEKDFTENIFQRIKNSIGSNITSIDTKNEIMKDLSQYYPNKLEKNMGAEIIEFQTFEQLLAIELLDIIVKNKIIKKCRRCKRYFITNTQKREYCDTHKGKKNHNIHQQAYIKKKYLENTLNQNIYDRYRSCLYQRLKRGKLSLDDFKAWDEFAIKLLSQISPKDSSQDTFTKELNSFLKNRNISIPRNYKKPAK